VVFVAGVTELRRNCGYRLMLYLAGLRFLTMAWGASLKNAYYLVHMIPFYAFFLACAGCWLWRRSDPVRWVTTSVVCIVLGLQLSWSLYRILWQRPYQKQYLPVVRFLQEHVTPQDIVCSSAEMAFGLGFHNTQLVDDLWMGRWSGKVPSVVVVDDNHLKQRCRYFINMSMSYYAHNSTRSIRSPIDTGSIDTMGRPFGDP